MKNCFLFFFFLSFPFFFVSITWAIPDYPLIVEVQIAPKDNDFIKIYNPTDSDIYLGNYQGSYIRLVKRAKTSTKDYTIKSWSRDPEAKVPAKGFYLWANKNYTGLPNVDVSTSQTIAANNGVALRLGPENTGTIIDALGWGDFNNILFEGSAFPENPGPNQKLERKKIAGEYQDTNNNANDLYLYPPSEPKTETPLQESETQPESQSESQPKSDLGLLEEANEEKEAAPEEVKPPQIIDLNSASEKELQKITSIGPVLAQRIIDARPFYSLDELSKVSGIRPKTLEDIKKQGLAWVDPKLERPKVEEAEPPDKGLAAISEPLKPFAQDKQIPKSLFVFLIALTIAIFSGIIILILKKRLKTC